MTRDFLKLVGFRIANSAVNCGIAFSITAMIAQVWTGDWRYVAVAVFFAIQLIRREVLAFSVLYTASFSTLLWYVWFPLDIALVNGAAQLACLWFTGNTIHEKLSGVSVMTEQERVMAAWLRSECPTCAAVAKLRSTGQMDCFRCEQCHTVYEANMGGVTIIS